MTETKVDPLDNDNVNQAAQSFERSIKIVKNRVGFMPMKSLQRVFTAVMEFPLAENDPKFRNKTEHELFVLCLTLLGAKNEMMSAVVRDGMQKQEQLTEAGAAVATPQEGEVNVESLG